MRSRHFVSTREPFRDDERLILQHAEGPVHFLNPTRAHWLVPILSRSKTNTPVHEQNGGQNAGHNETEHSPASTTYPASHVRFLWRSRDNRKGRHALLVKRPSSEGELQHSRFLVPRRTNHPREVLRNIWRTFTYFPVLDISWLVAFIFTLGSAVWVINAFFVWLPLVAPSTEFPNEIYYGGGITAFIGAIIFFETGSILLVFEAVNANNAGCFGWAVEKLFDEHSTGDGDAAGKSGAKVRITPSRRHCRHHHQNKRNFVGKPSSNVVAVDQPPAPAGDPVSHPTPSPAPQGKSWQWFPTVHALRTHYLHELGFLAGASQLFGATIFGIAGFTALPGIANHLEPQYVLNAAYWIPQVIGGSGFIVSSTLYMLETQKKWYLPAPRLLGWHIAFWNLIGAFGFTLSGALGMAYGNSGAQFQAGLATFWGSWAFLIGSYLQLYESLDKHPVEEVSSDKQFDHDPGTLGPHGKDGV